MRTDMVTPVSQGGLRSDNVSFCCSRSNRKGWAGRPPPSLGHPGRPAKPTPHRVHPQQAALYGVRVYFALHAARPKNAGVASRLAIMTWLGPYARTSCGARSGATRYTP